MVLVINIALYSQISLCIWVYVPMVNLIIISFKLVQLLIDKPCLVGKPFSK